MFENTVAVAGGVGKTDAATPAVVLGEAVVVTELLGVEEPEPDVLVSAVDAELFCEEDLPALPPQPTKYVADANIKPIRILRPTTLFIQDLLSGVNREYRAI
jgi:hypothetical protein